jgi:putative ribosome biogenesis GTPase RsgA
MVPCPRANQNVWGLITTICHEDLAIEWETYIFHCKISSYVSAKVFFNAFQVLLGDVGAGKSSLVLRFVKGQFVEFQVSF